LDVPERGSPLPVPLQARREQTIAALCEHFSRDNLTLEEFEHRLDAAHRVQTVPDLTALLEDLPVLATSSPQSPVPSSSTLARVTEHLRDQQHLIAIMGGVDRRGQWQPARRTFCYAMMGGVSLDFREAVLPPGETEVTIIAVMGGAEIIVPPGVRIDCHGIAIMGGFDHVEDTMALNPDGPTLRINGFALMGGVEIRVRYPHETARDAKRRVREEREERRRLR
jgi:hypothetical protein